MTDRDTKLRAVAAHFLGWEPGKMCHACCWGDRCDKPSHFYRPECPFCNGKGEIPPPDPADPAVRVALENAIVTADDLWLQIEGALRYGEDAGADRTIWKVRIGLGEWHQAYILADALLDAAYQLATASPQP